MEERSNGEQPLNHGSSAESQDQKSPLALDTKAMSQQHSAESSHEGENRDSDNDESRDKEDEEEGKEEEEEEASDLSGGEDGEVNEDDPSPPLPNESAPPLPTEAPPTQAGDDGWQPVWEESAQAFYFYNSITGASQWTNPRVPDATPALPTSAPGTNTPHEDYTSTPPPLVAGGYNPAIHGDYDPNASYAQTAEPEPTVAAPGAEAIYNATGSFNRFTGKWQAATLTPENFNDENKSKRQMNAFFDVDAAANSHDGRSLKAERSGKKLSKEELKAFKEKRKARKEEKRRAWLRD
jgi:WW domain